MKTKSITLVALFFAAFSTLYGQLETFDLSDYKLADINRKSIDTYFSFSGQNSGNYAYDSYYDSKVKSNDKHLGGRLSANYNQYKNNRSFQMRTYGSVNLNGSFNKYKTEDYSKNDNNHISPRLSYNYQRRNYYKEGNFYEFGINTNYFTNNSEYSNEGIDYKNVQKDRDHDFKAFVPLKVGVGRIEQVQDARQAVYILDELSKINKIEKELSNEEILDFASLISELQNMRYFDARLQRIYELQAIDTFLRESKLIDETDVEYFSVMADFWDFGNRPIRESGTRFSFFISPGYNVLSDYYSDEHEYEVDGDEVNGYEVNDYFTNLVLITSGVELTHENPINLKWQHHIEASGRYGLAKGTEKNKQDESDMEIKLPHLYMSYAQGLGFYPNTRTEMNLGYSIAFTQLIDTKSSGTETVKWGDKAFDTGANFRLSYYISPQFRLSLNSNINYVWQDQPNNRDSGLVTTTNTYNPFNLSIYENDRDRQYYTRFSFGISYSIF